MFGKDQLDNIGSEAGNLGQKALLLSGLGSVKKSGVYDRITNQLTRANISFVELSGVKANPSIASVREGARLCKKENVDFVLAIGGGSVVDAAKAICSGARYDGDPWDLFTKRIKPDNPLPLGVALTLSATGSEMNGNLVISNPQTEEKLGMYHPKLFPAFSILDPTLTYTLPPEQTAYGAVDILSHVFEQYFHHVDGVSLQDGFAETIMRTVIESAPEAIDTPDDYNARANLMWASTLALNGLIGSGAQGDWACHMIEHELSAKYDIAHGAGLALVYPGWMKHVYQENIPRFAQLAINVWDIPAPGNTVENLALAGIEATEKFFTEKLNISVRLGGYGIDDSRLAEMAKSATAQGNLGSFKSLNCDDVEAIYRQRL